MKSHTMTALEIQSLLCNDWVTFTSCFSFITLLFRESLLLYFVLSIIVWGKEVLGLKIRRIWSFMVPGLLSFILRGQTLLEIRWMRENQGSYNFRTWGPITDSKLVSRRHNYNVIFKLLSSVLQLIIQFIVFTVGNKLLFICIFKLSWKSIVWMNYRSIQNHCELFDEIFSVVSVEV